MLVTSLLQYEIVIDGPFGFLVALVAEEWYFFLTGYHISLKPIVAPNTGTYIRTLFCEMVRFSRHNFSPPFLKRDLPACS
jgi:hypothetical protein